MGIKKRDRFPENSYKRKLLTEEFLTDFKKELDRVFETYSRLNDSEKEPNLYNTYCHLEGLGGFSEALRITSEKHNVKKSIYDYYVNLDWESSDLFGGFIIDEMVNNLVIPTGGIDEYDYLDESIKQLEKDGEVRIYTIVEQKNGYKVHYQDYEFIDKEVKSDE